VAEGILRARYRESLSQPILLERGKVYELTIEMPGTSNVFLPGHRITWIMHSIRPRTAFDVASSTC